MGDDGDQRAIGERKSGGGRKGGKVATAGKE